MEQNALIRLISLMAQGCRRMARSRRRANAFAKTILSSGCRVTDANILSALRVWRFKRNKTRKNVMRSGVTFVYSDTMGIVRSRDGRIVLTAPTRNYPDFMQLLCTWVRNATPFATPFPFTGINMNFDYGARPHRDSNNAGPSLTRRTCSNNAISNPSPIIPPPPSEHAAFGGGRYQ